MEEGIMEETINHRVRLLRKKLQLTQYEFSKIIVISSGQLACIETSKRAVNDRTVKLICDSFNVNEQWLRNGTGEMFSLERETQFTKLNALFGNLKPIYQEYIFNAIDFFLKVQDNQP